MEILGIKIDNLNSIEALKEIEALIENGRRGEKAGYLVKPNAEIIVKANKDKNFADILNQADLSLPDGIGLFLASYILKKPLKERVGDSDLMLKIVEMAAKKNYSIFLLGGKKEVVEKLTEKLRDRYKNLKVGYQNGYFSDEGEVINKIKADQPDIVFVSLGFPKQEIWIDENSKKLNVPLMIAEGGSFDFISGKTNRAPIWVRKIGLEWLVRLIRQPWRFKRQLALPYFAYLVFREKLKKT
jgi:N-acetylglucosaminyldiphosphoundecaprenol N-acetyl-beta-D-mannosaminyltransferase